MSEKTNGEARVAGAESGRRLLSVLLSFSESHPRWSVPQLADELGLTTSAVYRYIGLLREVGLVDRAQGNLYQVSDLVTSLAGAANAVSTPLVELALPVLMRLRNTFDETVIVARRSGLRVFTLSRVESQKPVRLQFGPGQAMSLHTGSMSRVLLAYMPPNERRQYLSNLAPEIREREVLSEQALELVRTEGRTESFEEVDQGIWGVASIIIVDDVPVGAIGCAAPLYRTDQDRRKMIGDLIHQGAEEIARELTALQSL